MGMWEWRVFVQMDGAGAAVPAAVGGLVPDTVPEERRTDVYAAVGHRDVGIKQRGPAKRWEVKR